MGVRKTESRLPSGYQAVDLGETAESGDGKISLISFFTSPLSPKLQNTYVAIVKDAPLAAQVKSFQWNVAEDGSDPQTLRTTIGELQHRIENIGNISISLKLLDNTDAAIANVQMTQEIQQLNPTTEEQIQTATENEGAGAANPAIVRELINGYRPYCKDLKTQVPEADDAFQQFINGMIFRGSLKNTREQQTENFNRLAESLEENNDSYNTHAAKGIGPCEVRLALLAMTTGPLIPWTELPEQNDKNAYADEQLRQNFTTISEADKIDLLNLARFPKTNIRLCAKIIEALRDKYFGGASFNDVMTGMNGTRGHWILKHYLKGPLKT
jgi:hypothetical protein